MSEHHDVYHLTPFKTYMVVFLSLLVLTVLTVWVATVDFGAANAFIAFGIATVKAMLVLLYFMHLKYEVTTNRVIMASGFFFLALLFIFVLIDIVTRVPVESTL